MERRYKDNKTSTESEPVCNQRNCCDPSHLEFESSSFNPKCAMYSSHIRLPYPNAKVYNNLAEFYSRFFLKKDNSKKVEKERPYDRDYSYYYSTLGMNEQDIKRYEARKQRRKKRKYAGWRTAKMRKYFQTDMDQNREPCRSYPPLRSEKIVQIDTPATKYKIIPMKLSSFAKETNANDEINGISEFGEGAFDERVMCDSESNIRDMVDNTFNKDKTCNKEHETDDFSNKSDNKIAPKEKIVNSDFQESGVKREKHFSSYNNSSFRPKSSRLKNPNRNVYNDNFVNDW